MLEDVAALAAAGADIIAFDATRRPRPVAGAPTWCRRSTPRGRVAMADCSDERRRPSALARPAPKSWARTLSGYTGGPEPAEPDFALVAAMRRIAPRVIAEGRIRTPEQAAEALRHGAWAVVVGSAITRPEHVTGWFCGRPSAAETT